MIIHKQTLWNKCAWFKQKDLLHRRWILKSNRPNHSKNATGNPEIWEAQHLLTSVFPHCFPNASYKGHFHDKNHDQPFCSNSWCKNDNDRNCAWNRVFWWRKDGSYEISGQGSGSGSGTEIREIGGSETRFSWTDHKHIKGDVPRACGTRSDTKM